jgi:hypothetical protein
MEGATVHVPLGHDKTLPLTHATVPLTVARECYNEPLGGQGHKIPATGGIRAN